MRERETARESRARRSSEGERREEYREGEIEGWREGGKVVCVRECRVEQDRERAREPEREETERERGERGERGERE